ncbi:tRNA (adenosine(37)-N6)-threonylcarbamoyltransferase complex ATPase subunit type 1 TsaE [Oxalobacter aliiformigenes]|uniref:tRNA (adenosine(37)-N6)-threonylcarbamoyltransferase complex ATPase subunit type 1 TsaE n=1 Tax=Oxalobacter aliiformigenes TaxID=2946593 RepID=UPI0022AE62D6|nr:tRNA (adenosine(37)-N6)-threonylcarbamoyltransferase complex ATPase subunit type 1 TsaE [Oxalobacter aliiformigenes]WAV89722.1 tRNA (adenosine(37)-N6)-threonylcarbamoyltransferase complex ATPase subunit type 1 TsaE [Oxalobacter aliiformigenes]
MPQKTYYLNDETDTRALGESLARALSGGLRIYLHGDLGTGKTTLTRAMLKAAGHAGKVKSPTYTLVEPYVIELNGHPVDLFHFDLYRMSSAEEFLEAGFREYFNKNSICIVEWAEKADTELPPPDLAISLEVKGDGRTVSLTASSDKGRHCLENLHYTSHS